MTALVVVVALCIVVSVVALFLVLLDNKNNETSLYSFPEDESIAYLEKDGSDSVLLHLAVCLDADESHVTLMAQEWLDGELVPGEVRVFTASPGCGQYRFPGIPMPPAAAETVADPCVPWALSGVLGTSEGGRPLLSFSTPEVCFEDLRAAA